MSNIKSKVTKVTHVLLYAAGGSLLTFIIYANYSYADRVIVKNKEIPEEISKEQEEKIWYNIKSNLNIITHNAEKKLAKRKSETYAKDEMEGLKNFYSTKYERENKIIDIHNSEKELQTRCNGVTSQECNFQNPLGLKEVNQPIQGAPKGPFSWQANIAPPEYKAKHKKIISEKHHDKIKNLLVENDIKNIINNSKH